MDEDARGLLGPRVLLTFSFRGFGTEEHLRLGYVCCFLNGFPTFDEAVGLAEFVFGVGDLSEPLEGRGSIAKA